MMESLRKATKKKKLVLGLAAILGFAILFGGVYFLIKRFVVDNIVSINNDLGKIINGDLMP